MIHDAVRAATDEMTQRCQMLYERDGQVDTVLSVFGPRRQLAAVVEDLRHLPALAQQMTMALHPRLITLVAEAYVKEVAHDEPAPTRAGDLHAIADSDPTVETAVVVATIGTDRNDCLTVRSIPRMDAEGRRTWHTDDVVDERSAIYDALRWAVAHPLPGGPLALDDLDGFVGFLQDSGLTPAACVLGGDDG